MKRFLMSSLLVMNLAQADTGWCNNMPECLCWTKAKQEIDIMAQQDLNSSKEKVKVAREMHEKNKESFSSKRELERADDCSKMNDVIATFNRLEQECMKGSRTSCDEFDAFSRNMKKQLNNRKEKTLAHGELVRQHYVRLAQMEEHLKGLHEADYNIQAIRARIAALAKTDDPSVVDKNYEDIQNQEQLKKEIGRFNDAQKEIERLSDLLMKSDDFDTYVETYSPVTFTEQVASMYAVLSLKIGLSTSENPAPSNVPQKENAESAESKDKVS